MNKEIKEILDNLKDMNNYSNFIDSQYGGSDYYYLLEKEESKQLLDYITNLLDYITNLQRNYDRIYNENCKLREEHSITDINLLDENYKLQQEIERLNNIINELEQWLKRHSNINYECSETIIHEQLALNTAYNYLQELKGDK